MKKLLAIITLVFVCTGCGHNIMSKSKVTGFDLRLGTFGLSLGIIENSSNLVRGNATLSTQSSSNTDVATGAISESHTTQFSSNVQMNEGNIARVLRSDEMRR